jgi:molecular chaperone GrpE (heat shock protein)
MERLENFEKALNDILNEYDNLGNELKKLRNEGKNKTTKFRELLGKKLVYSMIITIFKRYNLINE